MRALAQIWQDCCAEHPPNPAGAAGELVAELTARLDAESVEYSQVGSVALFLLDLGILGLRGMDLNVLMVRHPPADEADKIAQNNLLMEYRHAVRSVGYCFVVSLGDTPQSSEPTSDTSAAHIHVCYRDIERIFASGSPAGAMFDIVRRQIPIGELCPFSTSHEARGGLFKGRQRELKRLVTDLESNFVISGSRRIGKTSILRRAYHVLRSRKDIRDRTYYFDCRPWGDQWDCYHRIAHEVAPRSEDRIEKSSRNFSYMLERESMDGKRSLLMILDELDGVVDMDEGAGWPFFSALKEAVSQRWIRVIFAGYRSVHRLYESGGSIHAQRTVLGQPSPFANALENVELMPLNRTEVDSLVVNAKLKA